MKSTGVKYNDVKPTGQIIDGEKYMVLLKIWQHIYWNERRKTPVKKADVEFKFGKHKEIVGKVWECVYDLKIEWPAEMYGRVYDL